MAKLLRSMGLVRPITRPSSAEPQAEPPTQDSALLHPVEAAKRLGVSAHVLERWRGSGEGPPFVKFTSKTLRYRPADLDAFVASKVATSTAT